MQKKPHDKALGASRSAKRMTTRSVVTCGLTIALMTVSAWISIPIGPVPVTLQVFVMVFALLVLTPRECLVSIGMYLVLGAIGLPLFSSMRGGLGVLFGPTGGFLWGFFLGAVIALFVLRVMPKGKPLLRGFLAAFVFMAVMYACGWIQITLLTGMDPVAAAMVAIAPFVVIDIIKTVVAVALAEAVKKAIPALRKA